MKIEFSTEAETEGSKAHVLNLFRDYCFDFHMNDGSVITGRIVRTGFWRNRPTVRIVTVDDAPQVMVLVVDDIDKAVYC